MAMLRTRRIAVKVFNQKDWRSNQIKEFANHNDKSIKAIDEELELLQA